MSKTSTAVKTRWNAEHYTEVRAKLPKGLVESFKRKAAERGDPISAVIRKAVEAYVKED